MKLALRIVILAGVLSAAFFPSSSLACAACFGKSSDPLAVGMNWGIFTLMGIIVPVLGGFATFFFYLIRKAAVAQAKLEAEAAATQSNLSEAKI